MAEEQLEKKALDVVDLEYDGYKFKVNIDYFDDVEALELIDQIEQKGQTAIIIKLLSFIIGPDGYSEMKEYFVKKDGRFRISKLGEIYNLMIGAIGPKELPSSK